MNVYEQNATRLAKHAKVTWYPSKGLYGKAYYAGYFRAPYPNTPLRYAIWLHELGHMILHIPPTPGTPRWKEECEAWAWALREYRNTVGLPPAIVRKRVRRSLRYAIGKAERRGARVRKARALVA